ncbi:Arc family DNA-binding protein [Neorhizobium sp. T786]|uniref:Arc family DNA-binding protein n=1 Tax=Pseudorhizobium xiangyangii TaxID=2883104 RepID=UPI001CFFCFB1|nr:Arc family DNA-binding protein [Neorhizobium xiangyangii]
MQSAQAALRFQLRMPDAVRERIQKLAAQNRRSLNAEIIYRLEKAISETDENKKADAE